jgi:uncharacterized protein YigE (DUF2233 family)
VKNGHPRLRKSKTKGNVSGSCRFIEGHKDRSQEMTEGREMRRSLQMATQSGPARVTDGAMEESFGLVIECSWRRRGTKTKRKGREKEEEAEHAYEYEYKCECEHECEYEPEGKV